MDFLLSLRLVLLLLSFFLSVFLSSFFLFCFVFCFCFVLFCLFGLVLVLLARSTNYVTLHHNLRGHAIYSGRRCAADIHFFTAKDNKTQSSITYQAVTHTLTAKDKKTQSYIT